MVRELQSGDRIIIYGTGFAGKILAIFIELFTEASVEAFACSNGYKKENTYCFPKRMIKKSIPIYEYSELTFDLSNYYFINAVALKHEEVEAFLNSDVRIRNALVDIEPDAWHRQMLVCRRFCEVYGMDVSKELVDCNGMKFYIKPDDDDFMINFYGTFADTFVPQMLGELALSNDGPYEIEEYGVTINEGDYVVDVGANEGLYSCYAAYKNCEVYACDCNEKCLEMLEQQRSLYPNRIIILPYAISDHVGTDIFYESDNRGMGSLHLPRGKVTEKKVNLETLDNLVLDGRIKHVDFIKADIEGAERDLLRGATYVLKTMAPKLSICTYHYPEDPELLESIIKEANPDYIVMHAWGKLYAHV